MTAPRVVRCAECDRALAVYGDDDETPICAACADKEPAPATPPTACDEPRAIE